MNRWVAGRTHPDDRQRGRDGATSLAEVDGAVLRLEALDDVAECDGRSPLVNVEGDELEAATVEPEEAAERT